MASFFGPSGTVSIRAVALLQSLSTRTESSEINLLWPDSYALGFAHCYERNPYPIRDWQIVDPT
jgi:hypothetical protein